MLGSAQPLRGGAFLDDGAAVQKAHPVSHFSGESHFMGDYDHGRCFQSSFCIRATSSAPLVARRPVRASVKNSDLQNGL